MHTVSIDTYRAIAWCFWVAGMTVVVLAVTHVLAWEWVAVGIAVQITGFVPAIESIVARLLCREFDAYRQGQREGLREVG